MRALFGTPLSRALDVMRGICVLAGLMTLGGCAAVADEARWVAEVNDGACYVRLTTFRGGFTSDDVQPPADLAISFVVGHPGARDPILEELGLKSGQMAIWSQILPFWFLPKEDVDVSDVELVTPRGRHAMIFVPRPETELLPIYALTGDAVPLIWADIVAGRAVEYRYLLNPTTPITESLSSRELIRAADAMFAACVNEMKRD